MRVIREDGEAERTLREDGSIAAERIVVHRSWMPDDALEGRKREPRSPWLWRWLVWTIAIGISGAVAADAQRQVGWAGGLLAAGILGAAVATLDREVL